MDGELSPEAGRFLARRMGSEEALGATWQRYHLIRDCLRRPGESFALTRLHVDLESLDVDEETAPAAGMPRWLRPVAGSAIAASVAAAAVFLTLNLNTAPTVEGPEPFASPNPINRVPVSQPVSLNAGNSQRSLNRYVLRHQQAAGAVGQQGFVALVPIVATAPVQVIEPAPDNPEAPQPADETTTDANQPR